MFVHVMDLLSSYGLAGMCLSCPLVVVLALRVLDVLLVGERNNGFVCVGKDNWNVNEPSSELFGQS